ncbi:MAG: hypothetical protein ACI4PH_10255 [Faecousia sp.]
MFTKLLKQEWRATRGILGLLCLTCLIAAVLGGGSMRYLVGMSQETAEMEWIIVLFAMVLAAAIIAIAVCFAASIFLMVWRFYRSRFTDEGYLTFTLPVSTHQNLLSSLVNSAVCVILVALAAMVSLVGMLMLGLSGMKEFWTELWKAFPRLLEMLRQAFGAEELKMLGMLLLNLAVSLVSGLVILMLAVTLGSMIAQKHKLLAAVATYFGITMVLSFVESALMVGAVNSADTVFGFFGSTVILSLVFAVGGYFLMYWLIEKKLNLN